MQTILGSKILMINAYLCKTERFIYGILYERQEERAASLFRDARQ
jgi:hypothetical protein